MAKHFLIISLYFLTACSGIKDKESFNRHLDNEQCDRALLSNKPSASMKVIDAVGTSASYTVSGLGYASDLIITVGAGVIIGVTLCSPLIIAEGAARSSGHISGQCFAEIAGAGMQNSFFNLGDSTYKNTAKWRCPNMDVLSQGLRKVASCYEKKGQVDKSIEQLNKARYSKEFFDCISVTEKKILDEELKRLKANKPY